MTILAMLFPGQGSQKVGMLTELAQTYKVIETTFKEASTALGYDLWKLMQQGPIEEINKTWITQPALLTSSVAIWRVWKEKGGQIPAFMVGHSLGEYSALVCAGSLDFSEAITLVALRGNLMQDAVPAGIGAMYAIIGLDNDSIIAACKQASKGKIVAPVNFNSRRQVIISGHKEAVERAVLACKEAGAKRTLPLPVSVPSHCALMKPAAKKLALALEAITFYPPQIPVINNVDVQSENHPTAIREALIRQLYSPVRWTESIEYISSQGVKVLLEIGLGNILSGLTKQIDENLVCASVNTPASLAAAFQILNLGL